MATWNGSSIKYTLNGDYLNINTKDGPISLGPVGSPQKNHYYDVTLGKNGGTLNLTMPVSDYRGNRYIFTVSSDVGINIKLSFNNQSAAVKNISQTYDRVNNRTIISVKIGILNYGEVQYIIPGNPFGIPASGRNYTLEKGKSWSLGGVICFLAGARIRTPEGNKLVESLCVGDEVCVWDHERREVATRPLIWAGRGRATANPAASDDLAGWPVRICQDAFEAGVPSQDLLVTSEHCLFVRDMFVPARMLVNGRTIFYDYDYPSYDFYHLETDEHSVIWANDLMTESYLDTGNRYGFDETGTIMSLGTRPHAWSESAAAPLVTARSRVEPVFRSLADRASSLGFPVRSELAPISCDPDLHLRTEGGQVIRATRVCGSKSVFMIPAGVETLTICSRTARPFDTIGPFVNDRRSLGVLIGDITFFQTRSTCALVQHVTRHDLSGWADMEGRRARWTTGEASLLLNHEEGDGIGLLVLEVLSAGPYLENDVSAGEPSTFEALMA